MTGTESLWIILLRSDGVMLSGIEDLEYVEGEGVLERLDIIAVSGLPQCFRHHTRESGM